MFGLGLAFGSHIIMHKIIEKTHRIQHKNHTHRERETEEVTTDPHKSDISYTYTRVLKTNRKTKKCTLNKHRQQTTRHTRHTKRYQIIVAKHERLRIITEVGGCAR